MANGVADNSLLVTHPPMSPVNANIAYSTAFEISESAMSCVPPAPRLDSAEYIPTVAKLRSSSANQLESLNAGDAPSDPNENDLRHRCSVFLIKTVLALR